MPNDKIKHGRNKFISNYGGIGSLIETQDCSIIIETFDNWNYSSLNSRLATYIIKDDRLTGRLRSRFPNIRHIVQIPTDKNTAADQILPTANYFSKWFYCHKCQRFADYNYWKKRWTAVSKNLDYFNPPKCFDKNCNEETLEQIRFVMTCPDGHIHDIPWLHWNCRLPNDNTDDDSNDVETDQKIKGPQLDLSRICCEQQDLHYKISKENTELSGIWVVCKNCKKEQNLKGVFNLEIPCPGKKYWLGMTNGKWPDEPCGQLATVKVKTSNSVYYANTISSIYIPELQLDTRLTNEIRMEIDILVESGEYNNEEIVKQISIGKQLPKEIIRQYLETGDVSEFVPEEVFRNAEYSYFLNGEEPYDNQLKFQRIVCTGQVYGISQLIMFTKLKKITVQTSFTRQEPIDIDSVLQDETNYEYNVKRQSVSKNNFETKVLPGIESYGEGILFVLDENKIKKWEKRPEIIERTRIVINNATSSNLQYHKHIAKTLSSRKLLIHTLSHLIMRELEYVCGYPTSSLQERLYVSENMNGFLISAFDGTDGYMGGLATLCSNLGQLNAIFESAINRAKDCSSDPICMESDGQGVSQLNLAACHSCSLIPDISCELSNLFLDRKMLIGENIGYFN